MIMSFVLMGIYPLTDLTFYFVTQMLTCILSMVEKTRRALTMLQQKEERDGGSGISRVGSMGATDLRQRADYDAEVRRHAAELVAQSIRTTEERVSEVKRKAGELLQ